MTIEQTIRAAAISKGWRAGTALENRVALALSAGGLGPDVIEQQMPIGRYHLDFAAPDVLVAVEADGWHHLRPETAVKDAERDSWLRTQGWVVFRVDDQHGPDVLRDQLVRPIQIIQTLRAAAGTPPRGRAVTSTSGALDRFEREVDPDGLLDPAERAIRAGRARRAYMTALARKSAQKRRGAA